jgi:beta-glucosidase
MSKVRWCMVVIAAAWITAILTYRGFMRAYDDRVWRVAPPDLPALGPLLGYATAPFQNEGPAAHARSTLWAEFVQTRTPLPPGMHESPGHADPAMFGLDLARAKRDIPGLSAFRFGVDWARVEPREGLFDEGAFALYVALARQCADAGIRPVITLHHFVEPRWFSDRGSFAKKKNIPLFTRFAAQCSARLGAASLAPIFVTFNEPFLYAMHGYGIGVRPPLISSVALCLKVICNILSAHDAAYCVLRASGPVTIAKNLMPIFPRTTMSPIEVVLAHELDGLLNRSYLEWVKTRTLAVRFGPISRTVSTKNTVDILGVNHYTAASVRWTGLEVKLDLWGAYPAADKKPMCAANWRLDARALRSTLNMIDAILGASVPVLFTELGAPQVDFDKNARVRYMRDCFSVLEEYSIATRNLCGTLAWTIVDNFEWELGTAARFGHYTIARRKTALLREFAGFCGRLAENDTTRRRQHATQGTSAPYAARMSTNSAAIPTT